VVQESDEKATPTSPAVAPAPEDKVLAKPVGPGVPVAKPAAPPPVAEKPPPSAEKSPPVVEKAPPTEKPPVVVKKPPFKEKPVVRAKPPQYRPRYGYGGGGYY
jgi:hypothetical protein